MSLVPGPAIIRSAEELEAGQWTTLVAERNQQDGSLSINGGVAVKGNFYYIYSPLLALPC